MIDSRLHATPEALIALTSTARKKHFQDETDVFDKAIRACHAALNPLTAKLEEAKRAHDEMQLALNTLNALPEQLNLAAARGERNCTVLTLQSDTQTKEGLSPGERIVFEVCEELRLSPEIKHLTDERDWYELHVSW